MIYVQYDRLLDSGDDCDLDGRKQVLIFGAERKNIAAYVFRSLQKVFLRKFILVEERGGSVMQKCRHEVELNEWGIPIDQCRRKELRDLESHLSTSGRIDLLERRVEVWEKYAEGLCNNEDCCRSSFKRLVRKRGVGKNERIDYLQRRIDHIQNFLAGNEVCPDCD